MRRWRSNASICCRWPSEGFDLVEVSFGQVNGLGCVKVRTNAYSAPLLPGTTAQIKLSAATVEVWHEGRCVARHARSYGRHQQVLDLEHYLDVLEHKPGAFAGSKPLEQWRRAGRWPVSYDQFWNGLMQRHGRQDGTRAMIELLQLGRRLGYARLRRGDRVGAAVGLHRRGGGASSDGQPTGSCTSDPACCWRWAACSVNTSGRCQRCTTMTTCWSEPATMSARTADAELSLRQSVIKQQCLTAASADPGQPVRTAGRASRTRAPTVSRLPRGAAGGRTRGA